MDCLNTQIDDLKKQYAQSYNPARFGFIESLVRRANQQRDSVRKQLETKAQQAINTYQTELITAKTQAQTLLKQLQSDSSDVSHLQELSLAQQYYQQGQYHKVVQIAQCNGIQSHTPIKIQLAALTQLLEKDNTTEKTIDNSLALNQSLQEQEKDLLQESHFKYQEKSIEKNNLTLRSSRIYQQRRIKKHADDFIQSALEKTPENPGPLNPEMLAIRLLQSMLELSPEYLHRCSSYFETLLWLEKTTAKPTNGKSRRK